MITKHRYDYLIIWGHGLQYYKQILSIIRSCSSLRIIKILRHTPETMEQLIHLVYSFDYAPFEHLKAKTEYLLTKPCEVMFVFVENIFPDEDYFGDGAYRHIESVTIKKLKEEIRNIYNPRINGKRTEYHVVHASDNQVQTDYMLRCLGYNGLDLFNNEHLALKAPYHVKNIICYDIEKIPISNIKCRMVVSNQENDFIKLVNIDETPHYKALLGDYDSYRTYISRFLGKYLTDDHTLENLLILKEFFQYLSPPFELNYIIVEKISGSCYSIVDGLHRVAILKYQKNTDVIVSIIKVG